VLLLCTLAPVVAHAQTPVVRVIGSTGEFFIEMKPVEAPATVANFLAYVDAGRFTETIVHRSLPGFVIQSGGFAYQGGANPLITVEAFPPVVNEFQLSNVRGTVAMAKAPGNPNSATSQWFVNLADNVDLDTDNGGFTVFGVVRAGMNAIDAIAALERWNFGSPFDTLPLHDYGGTGSTPTEDEFVIVASMARFDLIAPPLGAVLPTGRSVQNGATATAFATLLNAGTSTAASCHVAPATTIAAKFSFQTTDPATNVPVGDPNTPVYVPAGCAQSFVIALTPTAPFDETQVQLRFECGNTDPAGVIAGVNTFNLTSSATPIADVIAVASTFSGDGIANIPGPSGTAAFAVAALNIGTPTDITAVVDTADAVLPVDLFVCATGNDGECVTPLAASATVTMATDAAATFTVLAPGAGTVGFDPALNRVFVRFRDPSGRNVGATSVALRTVDP
jgi:cyclophilin family peptidyl-prolyl cis-trans isomerase